VVTAQWRTWTYNPNSSPGYADGHIYSDTFEYTQPDPNRHAYSIALQHSPLDSDNHAHSHALEHTQLDSNGDGPWRANDHALTKRDAAYARAICASGGQG